MRKFLSFILVLLLAAGSAWAQADTVRMAYTVRGTVTDFQTGRALESVYVSIPGRHQATATNADGYFVIKSSQPIETLEFSYLGYRTRRLRASATMEVGLRREVLPLNEAMIVSGDAREIVMTALERLRETYCTEPEMLRCFYRETLQKRSRYIYVAEAVARLFKGQYNGSVGRDAAALEKSRVLVSQRVHDTLSVKAMGGPTQAITHDILKNNQIIFNANDLQLYSFTMEMPEYIGDRLQFVIRMTPAALADYALYNCKLYIDRELLTFTRIEAALDMSDRVKAINMILVRKPMGLRFFPDEASIVINYRLTPEGKSRMEYFRSTMRFTCDWRRRMFRTPYVAVNELVVTDVLPDAQPIPRGERFSTQDFLTDKAFEFQDPDFWNDYNIIEPSESLEHAIDRLRRGR